MCLTLSVDDSVYSVSADRIKSKEEGHAKELDECGIRADGGDGWVLKHDYPLARFVEKASQSPAKHFT